MTDHFLYKEMDLGSQGYNPIFGEKSFRFQFPPVPYSSKGKSEFQQKLLNSFSDIHFIYSHDISLEIILYLSEQKRLETPDYGDLDNYAKAILDGIKGEKGILIDDCQIQNLNISWIDTHGDEYFELRFKGSPDDFLIKPIAFYEMANQLYYPASRFGWTENGPKDIPEDAKEAYLNVIWNTVGNVKKIKHELRMDGVTQLSAYRQSRYFHPTIQAYHKSRLVDGGFKAYTIKEWKKPN